MHPAGLIAEVINATAARIGASSKLSYSIDHPGLGGADRWVLVLGSLMALFAVGGVAGRTARRLMRRSTPELVVLLDRSAAFYGRWPEDRLESAPRSELVAEAARCRRIVALLETSMPTGADRRSAQSGPIDGLEAWIALLANRIDGRRSASTGPAYA
jgi:hypothetical protein